MQASADGAVQEPRPAQLTPLPPLDDVESSALLEEFGNKLESVQLLLQSGCLLSVPHEALFDSYAHDWAHRQLQLMDKQVKNMTSQVQLETLVSEELQSELAATHERILTLRNRRQRTIERTQQVEEMKLARVQALRIMHSDTLPECEETLRQLLEQVQAGVSPQARQTWRQVSRSR